MSLKAYTEARAVRRSCLNLIGTCDAHEHVLCFLAGTSSDCAHGVSLCFDVRASRPGPKQKDGHGCSTRQAALLCLRTTLVVPVSHGPACSPTSHSRSFSGLTCVKEFFFAGFPAHWKGFKDVNIAPKMNVMNAGLNSLCCSAAWQETPTDKVEMFEFWSLCSKKNSIDMSPPSQYSCLRSSFPFLTRSSVSHTVHDCTRRAVSQPDKVVLRSLAETQANSRIHERVQ